MTDLGALPELQRLVDRLAATIDEQDPIDAGPPSRGALGARPHRVVDAALADARAIVTLVDHVTTRIDADSARSLRSGIAPWLGDLAGVLFASGRAHEATQLLMSAERLVEGTGKDGVYVAAARDPKAFVARCREHRLTRLDRLTSS